MRLFHLSPEQHSAAVKVLFNSFKMVEIVRDEQLEKGTPIVHLKKS